MCDLGVDLVWCTVVCEKLSYGITQHGFIFAKAKVFWLFRHVCTPFLFRLWQAEDALAQDITLHFIGPRCDGDAK